MKTAQDPRHKARRDAIKILFAHSFVEQDVKSKVALEVIKNIELIDKKLRMIAPAFPIEKINKVDLAILRLAVYEIAIKAKEPPRAVIDEAIELAKEYGGNSSPSFINGALGKLLKEIKNKK